MARRAMTWRTMAWRTVIRWSGSGRVVSRQTALLAAMIAGLVIGLLPGAAFAADPIGVTFDAADRSMEPGIDAQMIVWVTAFSLLALFAVASIGYLYRRERGLDWEFQKPDAPHDDHH